MTRSARIIGWLRLRVAIVLVVIVAGPFTLGAQVAAQSSPNGGDREPALSVDIPVPYEAFDGSQTLTLTIDEVVDPFEAARLDRLDEGDRYVAIRLRVENGAPEPTRFNPSHITLLGSDTALYRRGSVQRDSEAREEDPDLRPGDIAAGEALEGLLFFELPLAAEVEAVLFAPSFDRLITLVARGSPTHLADAQDGPVKPGAMPQPQPDIRELESTGAYSSTLFGHAVSWDTSMWSVADAIAEREHDRLVLRGDVATIEIDGLGGLGRDPHGCLVEQVYQDIDQSVGFDAPGAGVLPPTAEDSAAAGTGLYLLTADGRDGRAGEIVRYVSCIALADGRAVLRAVVTVPSRFWGSERELVAAVLVGITLPDWAPAPVIERSPQSQSSTTPDVPSVKCRSLLTEGSIDTALSIREHVQASGSSSRHGTSFGETCDGVLSDDERVLVRLEPGDPEIFAPDSRLLGAQGRRVPGIGDDALLFRLEDGEGSNGLSVLSVRERRDRGVVHFRLTLGRPDLDSPARTLALSKLARDILQRMPGVPERHRDRPDVPDFDVAFSPEDADSSRLSFVGNLLAKERAGEWTRGEGLLATLRLLLGELEPVDVLRHRMVFEAEATGVLRMAADHLTSGEGDDVERSQIAGLLDRLVLTDEELETMARDGPVAIASIGGPMAAAGNQVELCQGLLHGYVGPGVGPCLEWRPANVPSVGLEEGKYRVFVPAASLPQGGWTDRDYDDALTALEFSAQWFESKGNQAARGAGAVGRMPPVNIIFSISPGAPALAQASASLGEPRGVVLYPALQVEGQATFQQTISHELAHCFQEENLTAQNAVPYEIVKWREEGLAEYLSNVVYPQNNEEWGFWWGETEEIGPSKTVIDLSYGNFLFFQYLENDLGLGGIMTLAVSMPTDPASGVLNQTTRLAAFGSMQATFHGFLEAAIDGTIADTGGGTFPHRLAYRTRAIAEPFSRKFPIRPFGVVRGKLIVAECKRAELEVDVASATDSARPEDGDAWGALPDTLPEATGGPLDRILVITTVQPVDVTISATDVDDDPGCETPDAPAVPDPCPFDCAASRFFR